MAENAARIAETINYCGTFVVGILLEVVHKMRKEIRLRCEVRESSRENGVVKL